MKKNILLACLVLLCISTALYGQNLVTYSIPKELVYTRHNDDFTVCVRLPGEEWQDLYEYKVMVDMDNPQSASMVQFDFSEKVEMRVKANNHMIHNVKIRPANSEISYTMENDFIYFTINKPGKYSLEINKNRVQNLHIFANEMEKDIPDPNDPNVIYFKPGYYQFKNEESGKDTFHVPSNTTVYLAPGAVINGRFICNKVENVKFIGRGYIEHAMRGFELTHSKNIEINGITVVNPSHYTVFGGEVNGLKIENLKSFSCKGWSDGIDLMSCSNVEINDVFMRNSDDCIAIYAHRWDYYGDVKNVKVSNAILWADIAHPINIGGHGKGNTIENVSFSNIHILQQDEDDRYYQGCLSINVADSNIVRNVSFENIWIDSIEEGSLFNFRVLYNPKYSSAPGSGIKNIKVKNVYYTGYGENPSMIEGYDKNRQVENIEFENIVINGQRVTNLKDAGIKVGDFTKKVTIK